MALILKKVDRPRELKWYQASSMLYGDWGTSKAYVLGLAFAIAGHASLFFLFAMSALTAVIGFCYVIICKVYPDGGGVYSAVRSRSRLLAVIGALLLIADYVVTASLSSLDAFHYLGCSHPAIWAIGALILVGIINIVGPTKSGNIATLIAFFTILCLAVLCIAVVPHLKEVQITLPQGSIFSNWTKFVGIVLALSGVEAIANVTGVMVEPVKRTAKRAIFPVLIEVIVITLILGAAMNAMPGLTGHTEDMIHALGSYYIAPWFGKVIAVVLGLLLLSACNTAIMGLISITFLMSKDKELPPIFSDLNRYGMPWFGLFVATAAPILVLIFEHDVVQLAALYAIGVVGAITINLGACCTNMKLGIKKPERWLLGAASVVMVIVEATIIYEKHHAVIFALSVLAVGLCARSIAQGIEKARILVPKELAINVLTLEEAQDLMPLYSGSTLLALKTVSSRLVDEAVLHAKERSQNVVYALFVEEKPPGWAYPVEVEPSHEAVHILKKAEWEFNRRGMTMIPLWNFGSNAATLIVKTANDLNLSTVVIGTTKRGAIERLARGEILKQIADGLPPDKKLVICNT